MALRATTMCKGAARRKRSSRRVMRSRLATRSTSSCTSDAHEGRAQLVSLGVLRRGRPNACGLCRAERRQNVSGGAVRILPLVPEALKRRTFGSEASSFFFEEPAFWSDSPRVFGVRDAARNSRGTSSAAGAGDGHVRVTSVCAHGCGEFRREVDDPRCSLPRRSS